ncbi:MAG: cob(I)yrinic acid a,c-diamide adenosyltransferase [Bacteroidia bacterium]|nr:cob(I)yrinic acid a,c-diamide adenosyltransferase [Bacteroidia bacterium]
MNGMIHVYTGNGKGKTTAALGLAIRAVGARKKVFFAQFVKGKPYSEIGFIKSNIPAITIKQYGLGCFIVNVPTQDDVDAACKGLSEVSSVLKSGDYDVVILDEANIAVYYNLFSVDDLIRAISERDGKTEVIITGRYASEKLLEIADLVTEMKELKHYFRQGVEAREGIEY